MALRYVTIQYATGPSRGPRGNGPLEAEATGVVKHEIDAQSAITYSRIGGKVEATDAYVTIDGPARSANGSITNGRYTKSYCVGFGANGASVTVDP